MADCGACQPENGFSIEVPGVPTGRYVVPLVRVNGKVSDLQPGMVIPAWALGLNAAMLVEILTTSAEDLCDLRNALTAASCA